ncbi:hypothetical protein BU16DRAFT_523177 [Lophium mytilinum]|uniref:Uncharacterized protein n=1 Tax=Lophium mytilinum TaxID=390894 RepID=A0A6A6R6F1_9PEZI|nr:hypothetical protein BU16DRAFT_523177 [Lophium mytilinum]
MLPYRLPAPPYLYSRPSPPQMTSPEVTETDLWTSAARRSPAVSVASSGLSSLEAAEDDFGRLMIQNARAERRLRELLSGKRVEPFRKARKYGALTSEILSRRQPAQTGFNGSQDVENWIPEVDDFMAPVDEAPVEPEEDVPFGHVFPLDYDDGMASNADQDGQWDEKHDENHDIEDIEEDWPSKLDVGTPAVPHMAERPRTPSPPSSQPDKIATETLKRRILYMGTERPRTPSPPTSEPDKIATESLKRRILEMGAPRSATVRKTPVPQKKVEVVTNTPVLQKRVEAVRDTPVPQQKTEVIEKTEVSIPETVQKEDPTDTMRALSRLLAPKTSPSMIEELPATSPRPRNLPTSALARIVADARNAGKSDEKRHRAYSDSTINSLEKMVAKPGDEADETVESPTEILPSLGPETAKTTENTQRGHEMGQLSNMNARLFATRSSIKDANKGMQRLEESVSVAKSDESTCRGCKCHNCRQLAPPRGLRDPAPKWLVLLLLGLLVWYIVESTLCQYFCQPAYAGNMDGFGVYEWAPEPPFVTLTLALRPFVWLFRGFF